MTQTQCDYKAKQGTSKGKDQGLLLGGVGKL
jgi:hypothetical protein